MFGKKKTKVDPSQDLKNQPVPEGSHLLEVDDLKMYFHTQDGVVKAVDGVSYTLDRGETLGVVGESGSGKSVTSLTIMGLIDMPPGRIEGGDVRYRGQSLLKMSEAQMQQIRGNDIAMIFQDPMTSLNPVYTIGRQLGEGLRLHRGYTKEQATARAIELLDLVGIPNPEQRVKDYPHQFSGGMRQRVMIAMALACDPDILIADEPTTALDVTIQAQIVELMKEMQQKNGNAIIMITHDLGVVAAFASTPTVIRNIGHIRGQESDRVAVIANELKKIGCDTEIIEVNGRTDVKIVPGKLHGAEIETYDDHRVAMSFSLIGLLVEGIVIKNPLCCKKTFENYFEVLDEITK